MGPLSKHTISEDALSWTAGGGKLRFRSHWYRSLPLSCMDFDFRIEGEQVDIQSMKIEVNGKTFPYSGISELFNEWLFILDTAIIHFHHDYSLQYGHEYAIDFNLHLSIPYVLVGGEGKPLLVTNTVHKTLLCH